MGRSQRTVSLVLEAAERLIIRSGVEKATIDEVAREAGISKGGVLHHFPSKEAIIVGLIGMLIARFEAEMEARRALDPEPRGSFARAYLKVITEKDDNCAAVSFALKGAFHNCPLLQQFLREANARWQKNIEQDGIDPVRGTVVRLATDGLWLAKLHRVTIPSEVHRSALMQYLIELTYPPVVQVEKRPSGRRLRQPVIAAK